MRVKERGEDVREGGGWWWRQQRQPRAPKLLRRSPFSLSISLPLFLSLAATIWFPQFRLLSLSLSLALSLSLSFPSTLSQMILSSPVNVKKTWKKKKKTKLFCFLNLGLKKRHRLSSLSCISSLRQVSPRLLLLLLISLDEEASLTATFGLSRSRPVVFFDPLAPASGERGRKAPASGERGRRRRRREREVERRRRRERGRKRGKIINSSQTGPSTLNCALQFVFPSQPPGGEINGQRTRVERKVLLKGGGEKRGKTKGRCDFFSLQAALFHSLVLPALVPPFTNR